MFASAHKLHYIETSALRNQNVDSAFYTPCKEVLDKVKSKKISLSVFIPFDFLFKHQ